MERMKEMYQWIVTWDKYVSTEGKRTSEEQSEETNPHEPRKRRVVSIKYSDRHPSSSSSSANTSCE